MRFLAVDLGQKRTGIAVGDAVTGIVTPVEVLQVAAGEGDALVNAVARLCVEHLGEAIGEGGRGARGEIVVGLPLNMDGTEGHGARQAREFGTRLGERTGRIVRYMDERLSSAQAEWELSGSGLTRGQKKERRDALAAAAILREFLGQMKGSAGPEGEGPGSLKGL
jgi:putative holliday junction resolvase